MFDGCYLARRGFATHQVKPVDNAPNVKCNWKQLHAVASVKIEEHHFASMLKVNSDE